MSTIRIQSQADTFALRIASPEMDWRFSGHPSRRDPADANYHDRWTAPLENGHWLEVNGLPNHPASRPEAPASRQQGYAARINLGGYPDVGWSRTQHDRIGIAPLTHKALENEYSWLSSGPDAKQSPYLREPYNSRQEAMKGAEDHYKAMFPIGTNTGDHDSGVDYSDLNSFKDQL